MGFMHFLSVLSYVLISISFTTCQYGQYCYDTGNFTTNSNYANNRNNILSSLVTEVQSNNGFFTDSTGQGSDEVYALALCRGDISPEQCARCINSTSQIITTLCPNQKEAYMWVAQALCIVRYADRSFSGKLELEPKQKFSNRADLTSDMTQFGKIWGNLTDSLSRKTSTSYSRFRYATEEANLTAFETIYAQMQCTPDLSQEDCDICLRQYVSDYKSCCYGKKGGGFLGPNCLFRWDLYPFYNGTTPNNDTRNIPLPPPPSMPTPPSTNMPANSYGALGRKANSQEVLLLRFGKDRNENDCDYDTHDFPIFPLGLTLEATGNFSNENKLGEGGFGPVYKDIYTRWTRIIVIFGIIYDKPIECSIGSSKVSAAETIKNTPTSLLSINGASHGSTLVFDFH
ncbi:hypothetical protein QYF36_010864 [Acer negundo]|nr:hypothetical protein QYF36_010864 [Acer negundo]